jgi:DNA-3-methyladenine glycosylase I
LAWITILRKRDAFRTALADLDPERVARFGKRDVARLLADGGIVRNRLKVEAAIANAKATLELRDGPKPLPELIWNHAPTGRQTAPRSWKDVAPLTPESTALSKELKRRGFRFVGPTTVYALMQACGLVNDHLVGCHVRADVERAQKGAR